VNRSSVKSAFWKMSSAASATSLRGLTAIFICWPTKATAYWCDWNLLS